MLKSYEDGVTALANAVRLGDDKNYIPLGATALSINRMDVFDNLLLPRLLNAINDPSRFSEDDCLDMRRLLIAYAVRQDKEDVFVKAISNLDARAILGKSDFQDAVSTGCAKFKSKQAESLCRQLNVDPTNTVEGVQR